MNKEIIIASAILGLLSSLNAMDTNLNINEVYTNTDGSIQTPKDIEKKIGNKQKIGNKDDEKMNGFCGLGCIASDPKEKKPIIGKKPIMGEKPNLNIRPNIPTK